MKLPDFDLMLCAISHSKLRKTFGLVVCGLDEKNKKLYVGYALQWKRSQLKTIIPIIKRLHKNLNWDYIIMDQQSGEHFIKSLKSAELNVNVISTAKNVKEVKTIENLEVLDWVEMTQLFLILKDSHQIVFPEDSRILKKLEDQVPIFSEHITEAGAAAYYAAGEEPDDLIKSLILCGFSCRNQLTEDTGMPVCGPMYSGKQRRNKMTPDFKGDSDVVRELSRGPPGRFVHYY